MTSNDEKELSGMSSDAHKELANERRAIKGEDKATPIRPKAKSAEIGGKRKRVRISNQERENSIPAVAFTTDKTRIPFVQKSNANFNANDATNNEEPKPEISHRRRVEMKDFSASSSNREDAYDRASFSSTLRKNFKDQEHRSEFREKYDRKRTTRQNKYGEFTQDGSEQNSRRKPYESRGSGYEKRSNFNSARDEDFGYRGRANNRYNNNRKPFSKGAPKRGKTFRHNDNREAPQPVLYENQLQNSEEPIRLNKYMSNSGACSRREADEFIQQGRVRVNGKVVTELGSKINVTDEVQLNGVILDLEKRVYVLLNKPRNCVTTSDDPQERLTVLDLVKKACPQRIYPVGRLDRNTTGVLLLTNDGELATKLMHPAFEKKKIYHVWLDKPVSTEHMQQIADGINLDDGEIHADAISYVNEEDLSQVGIEIHSGRNRIVRRIFESLGYKVYRLDRVYFAGLTKKNLSRGKWRYLSEKEVSMLRMGAFD